MLFRSLVLLLHGYVEEQFRVFQVTVVFVPRADHVLQLAQLLLHGRGLVLIVPEAGAEALEFQQFYLFPPAIQVKDAP